MKKSSYWLPFFMAIAVGVFISLIQTNYKLGEWPKLIFTILIEVFFFGVFTRIYDHNFFNGHWRNPVFIPVFLCFFLTSILYFFQNNSYLIYSTWGIWILIITWGETFISETNSPNLKNISDGIKSGFWGAKGNSTPKQIIKSISNIFMIFLLVLWITGFAFIELGSIQYFNYTFSENIYKNIPFLQWTVGIRGLITGILCLYIILKPLLFMNWKLDKSDLNESATPVPKDSNIGIVFLKSIANGIHKAGIYLDRIRLSTKTYLFRYWKELITILKQTKKRIYSICLMTLTLVTMFILGRVAFVMSGLILSLIESLSINTYIHNFLYIIIHALLLYLFLLINWFLLNREIFYDITNKEKVKQAIWYVFDEYTKTLVVKIPHFFWLVSGIVWLSTTLLDLFARKPFIFPGIYAPLLLLIHILIFLFYLRFKKKATITK